MNIELLPVSELPELKIVPRKPSATKRGSPQERIGAHSHSLVPGAALSRAEALAGLSLDEFKGLLRQRELTERQKHARFVVRRVLWQMENVWRGGGRIWSVRGASSGQPTDAKTLLTDYRLMRDLPEILKRHGCPSEHFEAALRLVRMRLDMKWLGATGKAVSE